MTNRLKLLVLFGAVVGSTACVQAMRFGILGHIFAFQRHFDCVPENAPSEAPLRRLGQREITRIVTDLTAARFRASLPQVLGGISPVLQSYPSGAVAPLRRVENSFTASHIEAYFNIAYTTAYEWTKNNTRISELLGCDPRQTGCVADFVGWFVRRVERTNPTAQEVQNYVTYIAGSSLFKFLLTIFLSPRAFFQFEGGGTVEGNILELDDETLLNRITLAAWGGYPTDALYAILDSGNLRNRLTEALNLITADIRTRTNFGQFVYEWLKIEGKPTSFGNTGRDFLAMIGGVIPSDGIALLDQAKQEIREMAEYAYSNKSFHEFVTTDESYASGAELSRVYGVNSWTRGAGSPPRLATARGLTGRAIFLAYGKADNNITHRGATYFRDLGCQEIPEPDPTVLPPNALDPPPYDPRASNRVRNERKFAGRFCSNCHGHFMPLGIAVESYDNIGRHRLIENVYDKNGILVASHRVNDTVDAFHITRSPRQISGAAGLNEGLMSSGLIQKCMAERIFQQVYAKGGDPAGHRDGCQMESIRQNLEDHSLPLKDVLFNAMAKPAFARRRIR